VRRVKLILAKLFHGYEIGWAGKPTREIKSMVVEGQMFPDISTAVRFRKLREI
jgi:hypothetical protein